MQLTGDLFENKAVDLVTHSRFAFTLAYTRSFWVLEGISTVKILSPENQVRLILLRLIRFSNACIIQSFQFDCCCQGLNFTASKLQIILDNSHN